MEYLIGGLIGGVMGLVIGGFGAWARRHKQATDQQADDAREIAKLRAKLESSEGANTMLDTAKRELRLAFAATAGEALDKNNKRFLTLANENLDKTLATAKGELDRQHQKLKELVKPLSENYGQLNPQIERLTKQTAELSGALTNNRQVGNWGEVQLRRIVEIAHMVEYCDFDEQSTVGQSGRPDMVIRLPNNRAVIVDAKASAAALLDSRRATDTATADAALKRHAVALKRQVDDLSKKNYGADVTEALDFKVMFVPGDQFLAAALEVEPALVAYAMEKNVAIATPASLIALLWTINSGWQQVNTAKNAESIRESGTRLYRRICKFVEHNEGVGKRLAEAIRAYNDSVRSFESRVVPEGQRFAELKPGGHDDFPLLKEVDGPMQSSK